MPAKNILEILIRGDASSALSALEQTQKRAEAVGRRLSSVGRNLTRNLTLPLVAAGAGLAKVGDTFQQANARIRRETGATGQRLEALEADFREAFRQVPESAEQVAGALSLIATRTGLVGEPLQGLTRQLVELSKVTQTDVTTNVNLATRVFGDWSVATEEQARSLDFLFRVSQATGAGVDDLMEKVVQFGAPLRQMGFDFEQAAALIGKFQAEGVNLEVVLSSLRQGLGRMAKEGINDPAEAFRVLIKRIEEAGSAGEATRLAIETFGSRAGPDMAAAIREGRFALDELIAKLGESEDTILGVAEETRTFGENLRVMGNRLLVALEPLGTALLRTFRSLEPALDRTIGLLARIVQAAAALPRPIQLAAVAFVGLAAALGPVLLLAGQLIQTFASIAIIASLAASVGGIGAVVAALGTIATVGVPVLAVLAGLTAVFLAIRARAKDAGDAIDTAAASARIAALEAQRATGAHLSLADAQELSALRAALQDEEERRAAAGIRLAGLEARRAAGAHLSLAEQQEFATLTADRERRAAGELARQMETLREGIERLTDAQIRAARATLGVRFLEIADQMREVNHAIEEIEGRGRAIVSGTTGARLGTRLSRADRAELERLQAQLRRLTSDGEEVQATIDEMFSVIARRASEAGDAIAEATGGLDPSGLEAVAEKGKKAVDPVAEALKRLARDLKAAETQAEVLGERFNLDAAKASAYEAAISALAQAGVSADQTLGSMGLTLRDLGERLREARAEEFLEGLRAQTRELTLSEEAIFRLRAAAEGLDDAEVGLAVSLWNTNRALEARTRSQEEIRSTLASLLEDAERGAAQLAALERAFARGLEGERAFAVATADAERQIMLARLAAQGATPITLAYASAWSAVAFAAAEAKAKLEEAERVRIAELTAKLQHLQQVADSMARHFTDAFLAIIDGSKGLVEGIREMVANILRDLARLLAQRFFARLLFGVIAGGAGGGGGAARAQGGPVQTGRTFLVGEEGPELFVPDVSGTVIPADLTERLVARERLSEVDVRRLRQLGVEAAGPERFLPPAIARAALSADGAGFGRAPALPGTAGGTGSTRRVDTSDQVERLFTSEETLRSLASSSDQIERSDAFRSERTERTNRVFSRALEFARSILERQTVETEDRAFRQLSDSIARERSLVERGLVVRERLERLKPERTVPVDRLEATGDLLGREPVVSLSGPAGAAGTSIERLLRESRIERAEVGLDRVTDRILERTQLSDRERERLEALGIELVQPERLLPEAPRGVSGPLDDVRLPPSVVAPDRAREGAERLFSSEPIARDLVERAVDRTRVSQVSERDIGRLVERDTQSVNDRLQSERTSALFSRALESVRSVLGRETRDFRERTFDRDSRIASRAERLAERVLQREMRDREERALRDSSSTIASDRLERAERTALERIADRTQLSDVERERLERIGVEAVPAVRFLAGEAVAGRSPGFAEGGRPPMGAVSLVGERGPELFVPDVAGIVVPAEISERILRGERLNTGMARRLESLGVQLVEPEGLLPRFQEGGPMAAGLPGVVGEEGPELFIPRSGRASGATGGETTIVEQHIPIVFEIRAIDTRDMRAALEEQGPVIADVVRRAARFSFGHRNESIR